MDAKIPTIDNGQLWVPLDKMQELIAVKSEATMIVINEHTSNQKDLSGWKFKSQAFLLKDIIDIVNSKKVLSYIVYLILLLLAMLAIFDAQVLSIFRRRKEIGTLIALGMTRLKVIRIFTFEGIISGILAAVAGAVYGTPILILTAKKGIPLSQKVLEANGYFPSGNLYPSYSVTLILGTLIIVMLAVAIVSYLPSSKISKLSPTEALKGKIT